MVVCSVLCWATHGRWWSFVLYCVVLYVVEGGRLFCILVVLHVVVCSVLCWATCGCLFCIVLGYM